MKKNRPNRNGYALMLVMVFVVLFGAVLGVAWRRVGSALRIERAAEIRKQSDRGSVQVLAQAMRVLETRLRLNNDGEAELDVSSTTTPDYRTTFTFRSESSYDISDDPDRPNIQWYIIRFDRQADGQWTVNITSTKTEPSDPVLPSNPP